MAENGSSNDRTDATGLPSIDSKLLPAFTDGSHPLRPTAGGGLLLVVASGLCSLLAAGVLPAQVRIRWSVGTSYGPEFAPTMLVLAGFPVAIGAVFVGARALATGLRRRTELDDVRPVYEACTLAVLVALGLGQLGLVLANLL